MKFFVIAFLVLTLGSGYFWYTDGPGSGMAWPTGIFAALLIGTLIYTKAKTGYWLSDSATTK